MVVSSAKRIVFVRFRQDGRSFVYMINKRGPNTDPWGTPHFVYRNRFHYNYVYIEIDLRGNF